MEGSQMFKAREEAIAAPQFGRAVPAAALTARQFAPLSWAERLGSLDLAPDLGSHIGSGRWFRGLATMIGLGAAAIAFWPGIAPVAAAPAVRLDANGRDELRSQMIAPLALGADSGRHMAANFNVTPLKAAPERPEIALLATLTPGDGFAGMLRRAGVVGADAERVLALVGNAIDPMDLTAGTQVDITLGRRATPGESRPLKSLAFRARFDLALAVTRGDAGANLALTRTPIRVDETPLRIRGTVGASLYRSARAAGAPASAVQSYLRALGQQVDLDEGLLPTDTFDIIVQHRRAATGERQAGELLYAGIDRNERPRVQLMRWGNEFYEASGVGEQKSGLVAPVPGRLTSHYGQRRHPVLGYVRMHAGLDFKASYGTPIVAVTDGRVSGAGRMGGCGNAVRLDHGGALQTRYCHMSQIAVRRGQTVRRGQVIGYVGSTGLSTGPHLHYEMYRGGRPVNPANVSFVTRAQLAGSELRRFRESLAVLKDVAPGAALGDLSPTAAERAKEPVKREIDRLDQARVVG
jgi:murein DD-endopeptidase MepM/ murein hydrolase activator NlpD